MSSGIDEEERKIISKHWRLNTTVYTPFGHEVPNTQCAEKTKFCVIGLTPVTLGGSSRPLQSVETKIKNVRYALEQTLPDALGRAFANWLLEWWVLRGR